jgi:Na+/H+ antiporter NhaD/arsenite permease-like protein
MNSIVPIVFAAVYLGMILGRIPGLALDRTGVAMLGAIVLLASGRIEVRQLPLAIDIGTISLLFGLMILSAQFRLAGTYSFIVREVGKRDLPVSSLLAAILLATAALSALLINDIVCLAMTPVVIEICSRRGIDPVPFLLGVACSSNIGSAATLVGNPQNILVGQALKLSFSDYLLNSLVPVLLSLVLLWSILCHQYRDRWHAPMAKPEVTVPPFSKRQTVKGGAAAIFLLAVFIIGIWPRDLAALSIAGLLLCSRRMRSREILSIVDWQLLVLFISLFIVNFALRESGAIQAVQVFLQDASVNLRNPGWLFMASAGLSNIVSNVPAVMLLLPLAKHPLAGPALALSSTLAGNLLIIGSIANIIVVDQASRLGVHIGWRQHARTGVPVTLASLAIAGLWLWIRS